MRNGSGEVERDDPFPFFVALFNDRLADNGPHAIQHDVEATLAFPNSPHHAVKVVGIKYIRFHAAGAATQRPHVILGGSGVFLLHVDYHQLGSVLGQTGRHLHAQLAAAGEEGDLARQIEEFLVCHVLDLTN